MKNSFRTLSAISNRLINVSKRYCSSFHKKFKWSIKSSLFKSMLKLKIDYPPLPPTPLILISDHGASNVEATLRGGVRVNFIFLNIKITNI